MAASLKQQIDSLLGKLNPGTTIGLDIGAHSIKVCELSGTPGKFKIEKFGVITLPEASLIEDEVQKPSDIVDSIASALEDAKIKSRTVCLGLFGPNTMTKRLSVPEGTKEEIEDQIMWEAEQYITFGADESQIDFHILGDNEGGGKDAFVAAAKNDLIESFSELLKQAKLNIKFVDLNVIAISNVFEEIFLDSLEEFSQGSMILDFGAQTTKVIIYKNGAPIFTKEISIGGSSITEEIQRQMGVSYEEAEDLKTSDNLPQEILTIIQNQVLIHVEEVRKNVSFYITQGSAEKVNYCFITGGSSLLPDLKEKLIEALAINVERLDISRGFKIGNGKFNDNPEHFAAIASTAIGLAMRKVN